MSETKRLFVLRHAKSSWDDPTLADHERPLAPRGRKAAKRMGEHLRGKQPRDSQVLVSSAKRARETLELAGLRGQVQVEPELYGAAPDQLLDRLQRVPEEVDAVVLIGHNPALQELTAGLAGRPAEFAEKKFPTAGLATLTFAGPWRGLRWGSAELAAFITPRELA